MTSLYEHTGGGEALHRLEELFYQQNSRAKNDAELHALRHVPRWTRPGEIDA